MVYDHTVDILTTTASGHIFLALLGHLSLTSRYGALSATDSHAISCHTSLASYCDEEWRLERERERRNPDGEFKRVVGESLTFAT